MNRTLGLNTNVEKDSLSSSNTNTPERGAKSRKSFRRAENSVELPQLYFKCEMERNMETLYRNSLQMYSYATKRRINDDEDDKGVEQDENVDEEVA